MKCVILCCTAKLKMGNRKDFGDKSAIFLNTILGKSVFVVRPQTLYTQKSV